MHKQSPRVSVVMSVYNGEKYLREAVESILNQTFTDFELVVIDDCSVDGTAAILDSYTNAHIKRIKNAKNIGPAGSRNRGIAVAQGEYIAIMDGDDISLPERLMVQVDFLDMHPYIGVLGAGMEIVDADGNRNGRTWMHPETSNLVHWTLFFHNSMVHSTVMMRRGLLVQVGCYQDPYAEDYDLWCRLSQITKLYNLPLILLRYRQHKNQLTGVNKLEIPVSDVSISQRMFALFLGKPIPVEWIKCLRGYDYHDYNINNNCCKLILTFNKNFAAVYKFSEQETLQIRKSTAGKIFDLARRGGYHSWIYIIWSCVLNPPIIKEIWQILRRKLNFRNVSDRDER